MRDFNKKYEYHFNVYLRNKKKFRILYVSDLEHIDEAFEEFIQNKNYLCIDIIKHNKLIPGYLNTFDISYITISEK